MRFREISLSFKLAETAESQEDLERHRRYKYPAMKKTLGGFSLEIAAGEFTDSEIIVMLGQNGTGKTTFIRILAGHEKPDAEEDIPMLNVSYKPQKINPKYEGSVRSLLMEKIQTMFIHAQFQTDVVKPLQIERLLDQVKKEKKKDIATTLLTKKIKIK